MKIRETVSVIENEMIAADIYSLTLQTEQIAGAAKPGQFVSVYANDESRLLPRPISICEILEGGVLRLVFRIAGKGTKEFSGLRKGDSVTITGPLGNGFPAEEITGKRVLVIGGGIGIPPMVELSKALKASSVTAVLGFRDELFLTEAFGCPVYLATEDGSAGVKGNVLDAIRANALEADVICACGPTPMLRALKQYAEDAGITCYLSLEEKMACGIGACLSCVCHSKEMDAHSRVKNKRVCTEGPVFLSTEVEL